MSRLYYTEQGNVVPSLCEELTRFRRARKVLQLPSTQADGTLYLLARCACHGCMPLQLSINGRQLASVAPSSSGIYEWHSVTCDGALLKEGANVMEFWTDGTAMDGWSLAIEGGYVHPQSYVSDDAGKHWRNNRMSYLNILSGEYVVRIRLGEGQDPPPPPMQWEDDKHPRVESFRRLLPHEATKHGTRMEIVRALMAWLSQSWTYANDLEGTVYAPWDPETILSWGKSRQGHNGRLPVVMCVQYGIAMVSACQAIGIPARCAILCGAMDRTDGHFGVEVWFDEYQKWVFVDPNIDVIFIKNGEPLSIREIRMAISELGRWAEWGPGTAFQRSNTNVAQFIDQIYLPGTFFRHRALWARSDFLSHPELTPPGHGCTSYCETLLVWEQPDLQQGFGMFPGFGDASYFSMANID